MKTELIPKEIELAYLNLKTAIEAQTELSTKAKIDLEYGISELVKRYFD